MLYRFVLAPLLFVLPAETAHHFAFGALRMVMRLPGAKSLARRILGAHDPILRVERFGRDFASPIGLAAGFDKDAIGYSALLALGFGFVEIGTVTAEAQPGNPKPRMFRLRRDRALVNRLGFNNGGASAAAERLARRDPREGVVGVNIGKTKRVEEADAIADYEASARRLAPLADYLVVNVSSPNTPGLRQLQALDKLAPLLRAVREASIAACRAVQPPREAPPLFVKIAPDLTNEDVDAIADLAIELGLDGIVATNTTISRDGLASNAAEVAALGAGGLSGAPLKARSLEVLERLRARTSDRLTLISVGGVENAEDVFARIRAGATFVQLYTGFVYGGPLLPRTITRELAELTRRAGFARIEDAIGSDANARD